MQKTPTLFLRDPADRSRLTSEINPACAWVFEGLGVPRRKYDGTCMLLADDGQWWNRREIRKGKTMPADAIDLGVDEATGKRMCWVPNDAAGHKVSLLEAIDRYDGALTPGTYELCGPRIGTRAGQNPEGLEEAILYRHDQAPVVEGLPMDFDGLREWMLATDTEGVVWHHEDGRRAKLKHRDFQTAA